MKSKPSPLKIGLINTRGLPARYGAYEQTIEQMVKFNSKCPNDYLFFVPCVSSVYKEYYQATNVVRGRIYRPNGGYGALVYGLLSFFWAYFRGCRQFFFFGYSLAPFFWFFSLLGCQLVCNTDGIEWRRAKWGTRAKRFLKFCEWCAVKSRAELVFDADAIARYYMLNHSRKGNVIFYGTESYQASSEQGLIESAAKILRPHGLKEGDYDVLVMRLEPENNIEMIVEGYTIYETHRKLLIIGPSTPFFDLNIKQKVKKSKKMVYLGPVYDRATLMSVRENANCYIHGHSVGGTNPVLVEAVSLGRPIVAFGSVFNKEVLGRNGLYFRNARGVANCLNRLENDGNCSLPELDMRYSWEYIFIRYMELVKGK